MLPHETFSQSLDKTQKNTYSKHLLASFAFGTVSITGTFLFSIILAGVYLVGICTPGLLFLRTWYGVVTHTLPSWYNLLWQGLIPFLWGATIEVDIAAQLMTWHHMLQRKKQ